MSYSEKSYDIHGTTVRVKWDRPETGEVVTHILECLGVPAFEIDVGGDSIDLIISEGKRFWDPECTEVARFDHGVGAYRAGSQFFLSDGNSSAVLDPADGTGMYYLDLQARGRSDAYKVVTILLVMGLFILLRSRQFYPLHAAALSRGGAGVLFVASSGSGKSTLAYSLVRQGWGYLSDDTILLKPGRTAVEALAFRTNFSLHSGATMQFPDLVFHRDSLDETKRSILMEAAFPGQAVSRCIPRVLFIPEIVDRPESQLITVGKLEVMHALMSQSALLLLDPHLAGRHLDVLKLVVGQTRYYRLLAGRDLRDHPALIAPLVDRVFEEYSVF